MHLVGSTQKLAPLLQRASSMLCSVAGLIEEDESRKRRASFLAAPGSRRGSVDKSPRPTIRPSFRAKRKDPAGQSLGVLGQRRGSAPRLEPESAMLLHLPATEPEAWDPSLEAPDRPERSEEEVATPPTQPTPLTATQSYIVSF